MQLLLLFMQQIFSFLIQGFPTSALLPAQTKWFYCMSWPVQCRIFSSILSLYPLDTSNNPAPSCDNWKCLCTLPNVPWGPKLPSVKNYCFNNFYFWFHSEIFTRDPGYNFCLRQFQVHISSCNYPVIAGMLVHPALPSCCWYNYWECPFYSQIPHFEQGITWSYNIYCPFISAIFHCK